MSDVSTPSSSDPRVRILEATLACIGNVGLSKTSVEDIARAARCSRATVYRYFPGGRDEIIEASVGAAMDDFFAGLADIGSDAPSLRARLVVVLPHARRAILAHPTLQRVLALEPDLILPTLTTESNRLLPLIAEFVRPLLDDEVAAGRLALDDDLDQRAAYLARMLLSLISSPAGIDLDDPVAVGELVDRELLVGFAPH